MAPDKDKTKPKPPKPSPDKLKKITIAQTKFEKSELRSRRGGK